MNLFVTDTYYISQCVLKKAYRVKIEAERQYFLETPNVVNQKLLLSIYNADYNSPTYYDSRNIEYQEIDKIVNALSKMFETANKWRDEGRKGSNNIFLTTEKGIVIGYQRKKNEGQSAYIQLNENKLFDFKEIIELNCLKDSFKKGKIFLDTYPDSLGGE